MEETTFGPQQHPKYMPTVVIVIMLGIASVLGIISDINESLDIPYFVFGLIPTTILFCYLLRKQNLPKEAITNGTIAASFIAAITIISTLVQLADIDEYYGMIVLIPGIGAMVTGIKFIVALFRNGYRANGKQLIFLLVATAIILFTSTIIAAVIGLNFTDSYDAETMLESDIIPAVAVITFPLSVVRFLVFFNLLYKFNNGMKDTWIDRRFITIFVACLAAMLPLAMVFFSINPL